MLKAWTSVAARLAALRSDEKGVTALEYGVIAAAVIVAIATVMLTIGEQLRDTFGTVRDALQQGTE